MPTPAQSPLLIGSCEPFSGKSAVVLGLAHQLNRQGISILFGKPLATCLDDLEVLPGADTAFANTAFAESAVEARLTVEAQLAGDSILDADVRFIGATLGLAASQLLPSLQVQEPGSVHRRLLSGELAPGAAFAELQRRIAAATDQLVLLEAAGTLSEGQVFGLGLAQMARALQAPVVLVHNWRDSRSVDPLLEARQQLGDLLAGVVLNAVIPEQVSQLRQEVEPALERLGLPVFGIMPRSPLLRSVTVSELGRRLAARVLCCQDRTDLLVETLSIGAMNVNSAMEFFRRRRNMAVVTGADRTDIQLAALEASTQCLILTGAGEPLPQLISRAEELEVPVLKVDHDTLTTVVVIEAAIGHVRLHEAVKATYAIRLVEESCRFERLFKRLRLPVRA
jgi:BioD-like phosphotransacetylase family protein